MGHRAALARLKDGHLSLYYHHWAATSLDATLFWGPQGFLELIESCQPASQWMTTNWCEGAALLDEDAGRLLWFGGEDVRCDPLLFSVQLALMGCNWTGWKVIWAHHGLLDVALYLGLPLQQVVGEPFRRPHFSGPRATRAQDPWCRTLLYTDRFYTLENDLGELLRAGPGWLTRLPRNPFLAGPETPEGWLRVDAPGRCLTYFYAEDCDPESLFLGERWPGWRLHYSLEDSLALRWQESLDWTAAPESQWIEKVLERVGRNQPQALQRMLSLYWASPPPPGFRRSRGARQNEEG